MQVFSHRLVDGKPLNIGYYLTGNKDTTVESTTEIEGQTIFQAAEAGSMALVSTFLLGGVDPNVTERDGKRATPLHYAAKSGEQMLLRFLIDNGAHVDSTSGSGETPLMWAVEANHPDIVLVLLDKGANMHHVDDKGHPVAFFGANSPTSLHCLCKRGLQLNSVDLPNKQTLLHAGAQNFSASKRHSSAWASMLYLIETGNIDVNAQDSSGRTALHYACANGDLNAAKALMLKGGRNTISDSEGNIPSDVPRCPAMIKSFIKQFVQEKSTSRQEKLAQPDHSNYAALDLKQVKHFLVAFFVPNSIVAAGAYLPTWIGLWTLLVFGIGFTVVASFSMKQKRRSMATAGWFSGALFYGSAILFSKVFHVYAEYHTNHIALYIWWVTTLPMFYCYVKAVLADPGVVQSTSEERAEIYDCIAIGGENEVKRHGFDMVSMCKKPLRAKHCSKTGQCVTRFDHFCVWTGNAIGGGNHRHFVWYCLCQSIAQATVAHICWSYMFTCTVAQVPSDQVPKGFIAWLEWMTRNGDASLVTFFLLFYNSFVFLFVSTVVFAQLWYACRNVTSNEVWFTDRYRWMFRLGSRSYSMYDNGTLANLKEFFFTGDLTQVSYTVPPMNPHLTKLSKRYAQTLKAQQQAAASAANAQGQDSCCNQDAKLEAGFAGGDHGHSHGGGDDHGHSHGGQQSPFFQGSDQNFDYSSAVQSLPQETQDELSIVQGFLQSLIQGQQPSKPDGMDDGTFDRLTSQAHSMYTHYQTAMANLQAGPSAAQGAYGGQPEPEVQSAQSPPPTSGPSQRKGKAD